MWGSAQHFCVRENINKSTLRNNISYNFVWHHVQISATQIEYFCFAQCAISRKIILIICLVLYAIFQEKNNLVVFV